MLIFLRYSDKEDMKMELVIKGERKGEGKTMKAYELGSYSVSVVTYDEGWQSVCIKDRKSVV